MEIILAIIEHSSWPLVVLLCVVLLREEIGTLLKRIKVFKTGSVELQLSEQLHNQGLSKKQLKLIGELTADEIEMFLLASFTDYTGFKYNIPLPPAVFKSKIVKLQEAGLLEVSNPEDPGTGLIHTTTPVGRRFRALLLTSTTRLLKDAV